jgi:hypothetical protein
VYVVRLLRKHWAVLWAFKGSGKGAGTSWCADNVIETRGKACGGMCLLGLECAGLKSVQNDLDGYTQKAMWLMEE